MEYGWNILWAIIGISLLVTVHEFGHFFVARKLGFKVLRFSVGFGKPLYKRIGRAPDHTEYVIAAIPLGGYVRMLDQRDGEVAPEDLPRAFASKPPWQRILVMLAGPAANLLFAVLVLWGMYWVNGDDQLKPIVGTVTIDSVAAKAGLRSGDQILSINTRAVHDSGETALGLLDAISGDGIANLRVREKGGAERDVRLAIPDESARFKLTEPNKLLSGLGFEFWMPTVPPIVVAVRAGGPAEAAGLKPGDVFVAADGKVLRTWIEFASYVRPRAGQEILFTLKRDGSEFTRRMTPKRDVDNGEPVGRLFIDGPNDFKAFIPPEYRTTADLGPIQALNAGVAKAWQMTVVQAKFFWRMITLKVSTKNLSSVITIAKYAGDSASAGPGNFLMLLVLLSLSLGFLNLLPIPILDGGQIVFQIAEWIRGRPLSDRVYMVGQQAGLIAIALLMGVALFNDLSGHFSALSK